MASHQLISIPASHYCERARWALDYAGIAFEESKWPPLLHYMATLPTSGTKTVPVLKCPRSATQPAKALTDSADIVRYAHERMRASASASPSSAAAAPSPLYPSDPDELKEVQRLEDLFSRRLGVWARVVAYQHLFADRGMALQLLGSKQGPPDTGPDPRPGSSRGSPGLPAWRQALLRATYPAIRGAICKGLRVNEANAAQCLTRLRGLFEEVGEGLQRNGTGYLVGSRFTAADLTFASLASILLMPPRYGAWLPPMEAWSREHPGWELRDTAAGRHAMRMYELHREPPATAAAGAAAAAQAPASRL